MSVQIQIFTQNTGSTRQYEVTVEISEQCWPTLFFFFFNIIRVETYGLKPKYKTSLDLKKNVQKSNTITSPSP